MSRKPTPLEEIVIEEIRIRGPLTFACFMERCLYDVDHGFYAGGADRIGRGGDFFTAVSAGPVFGQLLAEKWFDLWEEAGRPTAFRVAEQGAHDGTLACDVLTAAAEKSPAFYQALRYEPIEPLESLRTAQREKLGSGHAGRAVWWPGPEAVPPGLNVFFANELIDAFPVHRVRFRGGCWQEMGIGLDVAGRLDWVALGPLTQRRELAAAARWLPETAAEGYTTEWCAAVEPWMRQVAAVLAPGGRLLTLDYGREAADYFALERTDGTLRGYRQHRRCDDPLEAPGETDLTADVNFSQVTAAAEAAGLEPMPLVRQETFLTRLAAPILRKMESPGAIPPTMAPWLRQFRTLTHPGLRGHAFHAFEAVRPH